MNSTTPTEATASGTVRVDDELLAQWLDDHDIALGCECANPALQIERWDHEAANPPRKPY
jgi:hypothetical protein